MTKTRPERNPRNDSTGEVIPTCAFCRTQLEIGDTVEILLEDLRITKIAKHQHPPNVKRVWKNTGERRTFFYKRIYKCPECSRIDRYLEWTDSGVIHVK